MKAKLHNMVFAFLVLISFYIVFAYLNLFSHRTAIILKSANCDEIPGFFIGN